MDSRRSQAHFQSQPPSKKRKLSLRITHNALHQTNRHNVNHHTQKRISKPQEPQRLCLSSRRPHSQQLQPLSTPSTSTNSALPTAATRRAAPTTAISRARKLYQPATCSNYSYEGL